MRILFLTHYYTPEGNAPATRVSALAERWVKAGHDVTVLTGFPNVPDGVVYEGYRNRWKQVEEINGVRVVRVWTFLAPNKGTARRILNYLSYMVRAVLCGVSMKRPDVMIATSPQFFCGWAGVLLHVLRRFPFVLEIRDIWPESIATVGAGLPAGVLKVLGKMEKMMYGAADHIVTVGEGYVEKLTERGVSRTRIDVIMNGVDTTMFYPREKNLELLACNGLAGKFVCSYVGTVGMACGLMVVVEAAEQLRRMERDDIRLVVVGDGALREKLVDEVSKRGLSNVLLVGRRPKQEIPDWVASSDVNLIHLRKADLFATVMPSKIFESAGCARPMIIGVEGFAKKLVLDADAGVSIEPENANELVNALVRLADDLELCARLGRNAHDHIAKLHNRDQQALDYLAVLQKVITE